MAVKYDDIYNSEYTKALGNSVKNLEASQTQAETALKKSYDASSAKLKQNRETALREAYISKMKEERDAPSTLARQGLGGGYAESNQAAITRNYQNNRAAAEKNYADNLTSVDVSYNSDLASLKSQYADAIANAKQNAISQALNSAAQRYNALKAEEEEAKAAAEAAARASSGGSGWGSGGASGTRIYANQPMYVNNSPSLKNTSQPMYVNNNPSVKNSTAAKKVYNKNTGLYYHYNSNGALIGTSRPPSGAQGQAYVTGSNYRKSSGQGK